MGMFFKDKDEYGWDRPPQEPLRDLLNQYSVAEIQRRVHGYTAQAQTIERLEELARDDKRRIDMLEEDNLTKRERNDALKALCGRALELIADDWPSDNDHAGPVMAELREASK